MKGIAYLVLLFIGLSACSSESKPESKEDADVKEAEIIVSNSAYEKAYDKALNLWNVSYDRRLIQTAYGNAHVIAAGPKDGEVLVLLHGMNASSTMWYPNIEALSRKYRVYAIDFLLEPGRSEKVGDVETTAKIMNWYSEIFDSLDIEKFALVGASRGGWLALNIALKEKENVTKIALLSPAQTLSWIPPGKDLLSNLIYTAKPKRRNLRKVLKTVSSNVDNIEQDFIDQYYLGTLEAKINKAFIEMTPFDDSELKTINVPVLVLIGDDDFINKERNLGKAREVFSNVETKVVSKAGHFLSMDQSDEVNQLLLDFLR